MSVGLTTKQRNALAFISSYMEQHGGVAPSYQDITNGLGMRSRSSAHRLIKALVSRGHIRQLAFNEGEGNALSRSLEVVAPIASVMPGQRSLPPGVERQVLIRHDDVSPAFRALAEVIDSASGTSPCQITITLREMPFAKERRT